MLMMKRLLVSGTALGLAFSVTMFQPASADEGMWTFDNLPLAKIKEAYGVSLDQAWIDNVQASAVRLSVGCSASVVSPDGLVLTNHHCVLECAQNLSSSNEDHVTNGFIIAGKPEEKSCPGLDAEILTDIVDETQALNAATSGLTGQAFIKAYGAKAAELETSVCGDDKALRCQVINFYQGGQYKLYKYHKYTDVRLVFVPEFQAAFFGGDPDNFNFPRYALDVGFLRLYENGKPIKAQHYLKWNPQAPKDGELTFVAGNPGTTERLLTASQLESRRDVSLPAALITLSELRGRLIAFSETSPENKRITKDELFGVENSFKAYSGEELALVGSDIVAGKKREEAYLKSTLTGDFAKDIGDPWANMAAVQTDYKRLRLPYSYLDKTPGDLLSMARTIVRGVKEREKPSAERLPEFSDSRLSGVETRLFSEAPIEKPLEQVELEFGLSKARENLTVDSPVTQLLLGKESPESLSKRLVAGTHLTDLAVRKKLWNESWADLQASDDPMIQYAIRIDDQARAIRSEY
ncbi:Dipeptidyl aminopeptidase BII (plasmid) [Asticcacaulis sp. MM231]